MKALPGMRAKTERQQAWGINRMGQNLTDAGRLLSDPPFALRDLRYVMQTDLWTGSWKCFRAQRSTFTRTVYPVASRDTTVTAKWY